MMKYSIINACSDLGVHVDGANEGPLAIDKYIDSNNICKRITIKKNNIKKSTNPTDLKKNEKWINRFNKKLYKKVVKVCKDKSIPITIGGDHSIAIGSALASQCANEKLGIIWIDAHADYNTFETTHTGNIHGLPLAAITGYKNKELSTFFDGDYINPKNCVIVGARSIDPWEISNLEEAGVNIFYMEDVRKYGIEEVMKKALKIAGNAVVGIHISYDLDVIDPSIAPGVSVPEENGITATEAKTAMEVICNNKELIRSLDLVEYNPKLDKDNNTLKIAIDLLNMFIK